jgi:hypothetical protein
LSILKAMELPIIQFVDSPELERIKQASITALRDGRVTLQEIVDWKVYGNEFLLRNQPVEPYGYEYYRRKPQLFQQRIARAYDGAETMLNVGIVTEAPITLYHGAPNGYETGSITEEFVAMSQNPLIVLLHFGWVHRFTIPSGIPCFYADAWLTKPFKKQVTRSRALSDGFGVAKDEYEFLVPRGMCHLDAIFRGYIPMADGEVDPKLDIEIRDITYNPLQPTVEL